MNQEGWLNGTLTQEQLKQRLSYDPETGIFRWIGRRDGEIAGFKGNRGYVNITLGRKCYRAHRLAWLYVHGEWPKELIDHINGVRDDNRLSNLRDVTNAVNQQNQQQAQSHNKVGLLGVHWNKKRDKFEATIRVKGKNIFIGRYDDPNEAHAAYLAKKREIHEGAMGAIPHAANCPALEGNPCVCSMPAVPESLGLALTRARVPHAYWRPLINELLPLMQKPTKPEPASEVQDECDCGYGCPPGCGCRHRERFSHAALIVRDCCEMEPADPDHPDTICIKVDQLRSIIDSHLSAEPASAPSEGHDTPSFTLGMEDFKRAVRWTEAKHRECATFEPHERCSECRQLAAAPAPSKLPHEMTQPERLWHFYQAEVNAALREAGLMLLRTAQGLRVEKASQATAQSTKPEPASAPSEGTKPFGYWHEGPTEDESDFFLAKDFPDADKECDRCKPLYLAPTSPALQESNTTITDEMLWRLAERLWEEGHISDLSRDTATIFGRAVLALAGGKRGGE